MKIAWAILVTLGLGTLSLTAQNANQQPRPTIILTAPAFQTPGQQSSHAVTVAPPSSDNRCPVTMRAEHLSDGSMVKTGTAHPKGIGQRLHLSLASLNEKQIISATLRVDGLTPKGRMTKTLSTEGGAYDTTQEVSVSFSAGPNRTATASVWLPGMSAVEVIALKSVEYGDGSKWELADGTSCQVRPDPLMLITGR